jgi:hypothetical protein
MYLIISAELGPGIYSASNRNESQKHKTNKVCGEQRADNLTIICEPIV